MRAHITIAHDGPGILAIRDLDDGAASVTNDAEAVVKHLYDKRNLAERRLIYQDTQGRWDELVHSGGTFLGFQNLFIDGTSSLELVLKRINPAEYSVGIYEAKDPSGVALVHVYQGPTYQDAFDYATSARSRAEWRGKWIRFATPESVKWAEIR